MIVKSQQIKSIYTDGAGLFPMINSVKILFLYFHVYFRNGSILVTINITILILIHDYSDTKFSLIVILL